MSRKSVVKKVMYSLAALATGGVLITQSATAATVPPLRPFPGPIVCPMNTWYACDPIPGPYDPLPILLNKAG